MGYYRSYSQYLRERFGCRVYRVCLDGGFTCPNRDGTYGTGGCTYCSEEGSWGERKGPRGGTSPSLEDQVAREIGRVRKRYGAERFTAYFQAYSGTYAPVGRLKELYDRALSMSGDFVGLAIGTRPDCVDGEKLDMIAGYIESGLDVWIEYGLQSANDSTLDAVNRGHTVEDFVDAVRETKNRGIKVMAHVIIGLPGEGKSHVLRTASLLAGLRVEGVKIHNLNILRNTPMAMLYEQGGVRPLSLEAYADLVVDFLERIPRRTVIGRVSADAHHSVLIEPRWSLNKQEILRVIDDNFRRRSTRQGRLCREESVGIRE